jgi:5-methylthioribose kinase
MHDRAMEDAEARATFAGQEVFIQGRIDPYHRFTARRHPGLAEAIEREVERMLATRVTLVHGDYSPKNLLALSGRPKMLDFEVAHWGDPSFDVAFCLTHLVLKVIHFPNGRTRYLDVARIYWDGYGSPLDEGAVVAELGCLLLARIDGKSKEDYITAEPERQGARDLGAWLLCERPGIGELWRRLSA